MTPPSKTDVAGRAGLPLVQPMYYLEPEREETYEVPNNYYFGTEMMVSPITDKLDQVTGLASAKTWIPQGIWYDFFNGRAYKGGRKVDLWRDIYEMPVLVREGSIIPLKDMEGYDNSHTGLPVCPHRLPRVQIPRIFQDIQVLPVSQRIRSFMEQ